MSLARTSAALLIACLGASTLGSPAFAEDPKAPARPSSPPKLDEDRGSTSNGLPPSLPALPPSKAPSAPAAPVPPVPAQPSPAPPQGYTPAPGYGPPQGYAPNYGPPPGYGPAPQYAPPSYYPQPQYAPPAYYPPPAYAPADGAPPEGYGPRQGSFAGEVEAMKERRSERRKATVMIGVGAGALGIGWLTAVVHGLMGELLAIDCNGQGIYGISCTDTADYGGIYIPVVGPLVEASTHHGQLTAGDDTMLALETILQVGGLATMIVGIATRPPKGAPVTASMPVTLAVSPVVTNRSATLGLVGTF